jgi:spore photoproduct lyase
LQNYLNDKEPYAIKNINSVLKEIRHKIAEKPWKFYRIGTWELGDSLAFEKETKQAEKLIMAFANIPQAFLELKTKSNCVDSILNLKHKVRTIISWSLNPQEIISKDEKKTADLEQRLQAMQKVVKAGYLTALHFDPIIFHDNWEKNYEDLIKNIFTKISAEKIAWISIGSLRFNPEMKKQIEQNFPKSKITLPEMVLGDDNKMRYLKPVRLEMYKKIYAWLKLNGAKNVFTYLCMERPDMWEKVFGFSPKSIEEQNYLFTKSLYERFSGLIKEKPILEHYLLEK